MSLRLGRPTGATFSAGLVGVACACLVLIAWGDLPVARWAHELNPEIRRVFRWITLGGDSAYSLIPSGLTALGLYLAGRRAAKHETRQVLRHWMQIFWFLFVAVAASGLVCDLVKWFFGRARPKLLFSQDLYGFQFFQVSGKLTSFPSGHSSTAFALATALFLLAPRGWFCYFPLAALVAWSRVMVGAHYPSDVIAGSFLAIVVTRYVQQLFLNRGVRIFAWP